MMVHYVKLLVVVYTGRNVYNCAPECKASESRDQHVR